MALVVEVEVELTQEERQEITAKLVRGGPDAVNDPVLRSWVSRPRVVDGAIFCSVSQSLTADLVELLGDKDGYTEQEKRILCQDMLNNMIPNLKRSVQWELNAKFEPLHQEAVENYVGAIRCHLLPQAICYEKVVEIAEAVNEKMNYDGISTLALEIEERKRKEAKDGNREE